MRQIHWDFVPCSALIGCMELDLLLCNLLRQSTRNYYSAVRTEICPGLHAAAKITIFAKNWKNRQVDVNLSKRAPTRSAMFAKTAKIAIIVKSAKNWKIVESPVGEGVERAPTRTAIFAKTANIVNSAKNIGKFVKSVKSCRTRG